jgi:transposase-like protein
VGVIVEEDFKRWTAKRKAALVTEFLQGKTSVSEAARSFGNPPLG